MTTPDPAEKHGSYDWVTGNRPPDQPPQVVYVYQQAPASTPVTKGIWDFVLQFWYVVAAVIAFPLLCCAGLLIFGAIGEHLG